MFECQSFKNNSLHEEKYFGSHFQAVNMSLFEYFTQVKYNTKSACHEASYTALSLSNVESSGVSKDEVILVSEELAGIENTLKLHLIPNEKFIKMKTRSELPNMHVKTERLKPYQNLKRTSQS